MMMQSGFDTQVLSPDELRRLSWRCRRGLLELDIVLQRFVEKHLPTLTTAELSTLNQLLDLPDNEFLDVITQRQPLPIAIEEKTANQVLKKLMAE
jgi:antitoxin CptB